jgi:hypothetical protein
MNTRRGLGKGLGSGYKNIAPMDSHIHSLSAKGYKMYRWDDGKLRKKMPPVPEPANYCLSAKYYDLAPKYDARASFYGKARVEIDDNGNQTLYSYNTKVAEILNGKPIVYGTYSQTTMRHIKEFLKQNGFKAESQTQVTKDYKLFSKYTPAKTISTVNGEADLYTVEEENAQGKWNDDYYTRDGFWVIHKGNNHYVYKVKKSLDAKGKKMKSLKASFQAGEVLRQLGGNRFIAMTGAKDFVKDDKEQMIGFKIGRNAKNVSHVRIKLNSMDTYDVEFLSIRNGNVTVKSKVDGIYNDQLQEVFTEHTGMYTHL